MDGLVIGLDLCDSYTQLYCGNGDKAWSFPTVICRKKSEDKWCIGEQAYGYTLAGDGIIVDKLIKLVQKDGTATIGQVKYEGRELLEQFLKQVIALPQTQYQIERISELVITLPALSVKLMDMLLLCTDALKIPRSRVHLVSHSESFMYYALSQKREIWNNQVALFDLSHEGLNYYEMKISRGLKTQVVMAESENLDEGFNLDVLESPSGAKLADKILTSCGERMLAKKIFSSILLTGKGFAKTQWAEEFMRLIARRRKVYMERFLFAKGACYKALDLMRDQSQYPYQFVCEGKIRFGVMLDVMLNERKTPLVIAAIGDSWYDAKSTMDFILDQQEEIILRILPLGERSYKDIKISLKGFPKRPNKTTRVQLKISFANEKTMKVTVLDKGFGELFPATDAVVRREIML